MANSLKLLLIATNNLSSKPLYRTQYAFLKCQCILDIFEIKLSKSRIRLPSSPFNNLRERNANRRSFRSWGRSSRM